MIDEEELERLAAEGAVKLLIVEGTPIWEASPNPDHQIIIEDIRATIRPSHRAQRGSDCGCYHLPDVNFFLAGVSRVRPDIAIFCERPPKQRGAYTFPPPAVIEIISPGYAKKDLEKLPPAYLHAGVLDVIVYNPATGEIFWFDQESGELHPRRLAAPQTMILQCGCEVTIAP